MTDPANRRRSQRLTLQVPVLVRAVCSEGESKQAQALTLMVNAHGGLLESSLKLAAEQKVPLSNPHSGRDVDCRVVRVEESSASSYIVAFEFNVRSLQFWAVTFPPDDWINGNKPEALPEIPRRWPEFANGAWMTGLRLEQIFG